VVAPHVCDCNTYMCLFAQGVSLIFWYAKRDVGHPVSLAVICNQGKQYQLLVKVTQGSLLTMQL